LLGLVLQLCTKSAHHLLDINIHLILHI